MPVPAQAGITATHAHLRLPQPPMDPGNSSAGISTSPDNKYGDRNSCHRVQITNQIVIARRRSRRSNPEAADSAFVAPGLLRLRLAMTVLRNWNTVTGAPVTEFTQGRFFHAETQRGMQAWPAPVPSRFVAFAGRSPARRKRAYLEVSALAPHRSTSASLRLCVSPSCFSSPRLQIQALRAFAATESLPTKSHLPDPLEPV